MIVPSPQGLLIWSAGVGSTVAGSWISSKIHIYYDSRQAHLDELKEKVLLPIQQGLAGYTALVRHQSPVVGDPWGVRRQNEKVSVTEPPNELGPGLSTIALDILSSTDPTFYADCKMRHFREQIAHTEEFLAEWCSHVDQCRAWVERLADEILLGSQLPPFPVTPRGSSYVMQYRLGIFVYRRLFRNLDYALFKDCQNLKWSILGFDGTSAEGTEQQMDAVLSLLDRLMEEEKNTADRLLKDARALEQNLSSLSRELGYAIAARRLHRHCDLVSFF
jgi:hypothetical protein